MQRRAVLNFLAVAGATVPAAMLSAAPTPATPRAAAAATKATGSFVTAHDGTRLYWTQWGAGRPLLFLNSAGMTTRMWDYQFVALSEQGYRCISFDRRGHGRSDLAVGGYDFDTFADDVAAVIAALDLRDLTLIGHSMASGEVVRYLARHGSARVARIMLLAPTTPNLRQTADNPNGVPQSAFEALRASWREDFPKWVADNTAAFFVSETSSAMMQTFAAQLMQFSVPVAIACNKALTTTDFRADLATVSTHGRIDSGWSAQGL